MELVKQEFDVLLDMAEEGEVTRFTRQREDFIETFAEFFEVDAAVLLDKGRMEKPKDLRPEDLLVKSRLRFLAKKAFQEVIGLQTSLKVAVSTPPAGGYFIGHHDRALRMLAGDLQKILQPIDQLQKAVSQPHVREDSAAFIHPDRLDPNDVKRQQTQARPANYPYDRPISYGRPVGTSMDGSSYQREPDATPPPMKNRRKQDSVPMNHRGNPWRQLEALTDPHDVGPQAYNAARLGYGNMGLMGDGTGVEDLDIDVLRQDFKDTFTSTMPVAMKLSPQSLFKMLTHLDPDFAAELFAPEDEEEMQGIYSDWGNRVYAPGAEFDVGTEYQAGDADDEDYTE